MIVGSGPAPFLPRPPIGTTGTLPAPPPLLWGARPVLAPGILAALWGGGISPHGPSGWSSTGGWWHVRSGGVQQKDDDGEG